MTNMRYFQEFLQAVETVLLNKEHADLRVTREPLTPEIQEDLDNYYLSAKPALVASEAFKAKTFDIDDEIKVLLLNTNPPKDAKLLKLPFPSIFVDINITNEEAELDPDDREIRGLMVTEREVLNPEGKHIGRVFNVIHRTEGREQNKENYVFVDESVFSVENDLIRFKYSNRPKTSEVLQKFVYNFILFLNQPDVERIEVHRSPEQNYKRMEHGKRPLPELTTTIRLTGKLKDYVNSMRTGRHFSYSYKFWVRGHFRTLSAECHGVKMGTKVWIMPYLKGEGLVVEKSYSLLSEKDYEPKEEEQI